jgi:2-polyprenyl-3-methyl-5-hydroxy-6-metoxy-1,4-benzoquinol methylase
VVRVKSALKRGLLAAVSGITGRTAVLLPPDAAADVEVLPVRAPYRVPGGSIRYDLLLPCAGELSMWLESPAAHAPIPVRFRCAAPCAIELRLADGGVSYAGRPQGRVSHAPIVARRFSCTFELREDDGRLRRRRVGHYLPRDGSVDASYYSGEDYVDYEAESESVHREVLALARRHAAAGPVLEIGCATGGTLAALRGAGFEVTGVDASAWAVERASERLGRVVWCADVERAGVPQAAAARGPFGTIVLAAVLEHFAQPRAVLSSLTALAAPAAHLLILTTNADSLTHRIFGAEWEGYFDWTHRGVEAIAPPALRAWLPALGWHIVELRTWHVWTGSADPTHATLRDWCSADARFRALLAERDLGDFIVCVARRA